MAHDLKMFGIAALNAALCYYAEPRDYTMHNEGRKHWGLLCTMEGTETYHFRDRDVAAQPGTVLVIPKNEVYTIDLKGSRSVVYVIDFELITPQNMRPLLVHLPKKSTIPAQFSEAERC